MEGLKSLWIVAAVLVIAAGSASAAFVSDDMHFDGTYEPDSGSPPAGNSTWGVFTGGSLDIVPNSPSAGLATFNDNSAAARMAMYKDYTDSGFIASPANYQWSYAFKMELKSASSGRLLFGVRSEGGAGKSAMLCFSDGGLLGISSNTGNSVKFAVGGSTDYRDGNQHTFALRKVDVGGTMKIRTYVDGGLIDTQNYSALDDDLDTDDFGYFSSTPGLSHTVIDDVTFVPEPATLALLAIGGLLSLVRRNRRVA